VTLTLSRIFHWVYFTSTENMPNPFNPRVGALAFPFPMQHALARNGLPSCRNSFADK